MVRLELLPHRIAHGRWSVVCFCGTGRNHCPPGHFFWGIVQAAVDSDLFSVLSYYSTIRLAARRSFYGPLHCPPRKAALEPPRVARARRELDYRRQYSAVNVGALFEICRPGGGNGPGRRSRERPASSAGLHADIYRWIPFAGMGVRDRSLARRPAAQITAELQRPGRDSTKTARTSGGEMKNARPTKGPGPRLKENPMIGRNLLRAMTTAVALFLCATSALPDEGRRLTLAEAVHLAVQQNRTLKI